jgi:hypothetical protein
MLQNYIFFLYFKTIYIFFIAKPISLNLLSLNNVLTPYFQPKQHYFLFNMIYQFFLQNQYIKKTVS